MYEEIFSIRLFIMYEHLKNYVLPVMFWVMFYPS